MDPELLNENGYTAAMEFAMNKKPIPFIYGHSPSLKSKDGKTVSDILIETNQPVPYCWQIKEDPTEDQIKEYKNKITQYLQKNGGEYAIPDFIKDPYFKQKNGRTFMYDSIIMGLNPSISIVLHSPYLRFDGGRTCAMAWAICIGRNIPRYLRHDPTIQDDYGYTVAMILRLRYDGFSDPFWEYKNASSIKTCHGLSLTQIDAMMKEHNTVFV